MAAEDALASCQPFLVGSGRIESTQINTRLILSPSFSNQYSDAQIDDYARAGLRRKDYAHRAPLRLSLRARFSHKRLGGTAGFGFWNNPFGAQSKLPALPKSIWFFYASPPSDMQLALDVPGRGWKAACIDANRLSALAWAPLAPVVMLMCRIPRLYRRLWPHVQRALGVSEAQIDFQSGNMTDWHDYVLEWYRDRATWRIDGQIVHQTDRPPQGALGFVAWLDNQYAIVTPQGNFKFGLLDTPFEQWLELAYVQLEQLG